MIVSKRGCNLVLRLCNALVWGGSSPRPNGREDGRDLLGPNSLFGDQELFYNVHVVGVHVNLINSALERRGLYVQRI